jgi:hypothetical protein
MLGSRSRRLKIAEQGCVSGRKLQQPAVMRQSQKIAAAAARFENNIASSKDGGGTALAVVLGRKISQQERGIRSVVGQRQEKIAAEARRKHVGRQQVKIAAGAQQKLALSSARASMLLGSKLRGGRLMQQ